jgi:hypothetical protein
VQMLLPVQNPRGSTYPRALYDDLARKLTARFGGVTAYTRAPATGLWEAASGQTVRDQVVVYEVMVDQLDADWWKQLRADLEAKFAQQELVLRAQQMQRL